MNLATINRLRQTRAYDHLCKRGETLMHKDGTRLWMNEYVVQDRDDFNDFVDVTDMVDFTTTWFNKLSLEEITKLDFKSSDTYAHDRIVDLMERFLGWDDKSEANVCVYDHIDRDNPPLHAHFPKIVWNIQTLETLRQLQLTERFTEFACVLIGPNGLTSVGPVSGTRRIFSGTRTEIIDVMLVDSRLHNDGSVDLTDWNNTHDIDLGDYSGYVFQEPAYSEIHWDTHTQYTNYTRRYKYIERKLVSKPYRVMKHEHPRMHLRRDGNIVYMDDAPFFRLKNDLWEMVPHADAQ